MPVPALPPDNTKRYKVTYTSLGNQHDFTVRCGPTGNDAGASNAIDDLLTALTSQLYAMTVDALDFAVAGSSVFNPAASTLPGSTYGSGTAAGLLFPQFVAFQGRSAAGHKCRLSVYGIKIEENDYRFNPGDSAVVDAAIDVLQGSSVYFHSIDDLKPTWYDYANTGFNAYWQRKGRT